MITIRPMTDDDFARFWPTYRAIVAAQETYAFDPESTPEAARALWLDAPLCTWIAEEDGVVLGSYYLKANAAGPAKHVSNCGYMVNEAARG
ncbi:GNAT family N-acetyltransferase, partial [Burkholderia cenocepacia]|nr:GNAT family N-acetyltransferase [Burkholderia cenocepacia]